jgi:hypothetical protein
VAEWERSLRKPPGIAQASAWEDLLDDAWCRRLFALRKKGKIGIVLAEWGKLYLAESAVDPWGSARRISATELRTMIAEIEGREAKENAA